jgi:hypothetical protein
MITRRQFLLGTLGAGFILPTFFDKALSFFENHGEPLLIAPKNPGQILYVTTDWDYEFRLDTPILEIPKMTMGEYLDEYYGGVEAYMEDQAMEEEDRPDLDSFAEPYLVLDRWGRTESPNARAFSVLDQLRFSAWGDKSDALSGITFYDGPSPGSDYLGVQADDLMAVSLVQHALNNQGYNTRIELA